MEDINNPLYDYVIKLENKYHKRLRKIYKEIGIDIQKDITNKTDQIIVHNTLVRFIESNLDFGIWQGNSIYKKMKRRVERQRKMTDG